MRDCGIHQNVSYEEYDSWDAIRATHLKEARTSFKHMRAVVTGEKWKDSPGLTMGRICHTAILEPERYKTDVVVYDGGARRGKDWLAFKADNEGAEIIKASEQGTVDMIQAAVLSDSLCKDMISESLHEVSLLWKNERYGYGKARLDILGNPYFADLKTTSFIDVYKFKRQFFDLGYDIQYGWITEGLSVLGRKDNDMAAYAIVAEAKVPFDVVTYELEGDVINHGRKEAVALAAGYNACKAVNSFPGVCNQTLITLSLPEYLKEKIEIKIGNEKLEV